MVKIVHLLAGVAALLLSFIPALGTDAPAFLQQPDALYLAFCGLINLLLAGYVQSRHSPRHTAVSVLVVLAAALQALVLLAPMPLIGNQPAVVLALIALLGAVLLQLADNLPKRSQAARPANTSGDQGKRETGTVKWFNTSKGFGFISRDSGDDIFVHFRAIRGEGHRVLVEGQRVEFVVMMRDKGLQAEDVIAAPSSRR
ncbi:cold-shock protein [Pseudomonas sp. N040]|nr:cold-shock protein [Pseudomonas sp. N040]MBW7013005.1 cold-shock protein [Pseudomonas sp. N040]